MEPKIKKAKSNHYYKIDRSDLSHVREIGQGGFGTVFHMKWMKDDDVHHVAAKRLFKVDDHELEVLSKLEHPNIVRLIGVVPEPVDFMLILELCELGSLRSFLTNHTTTNLPFDLQNSWAEQAARAIEYLQDMDIIHKDIKSDNFVISSGNVLKLTDFGLAKLTNITMNDVSERGTAAYMAPEVFIDSVLSPKSDIFAYGVVVWEIVTKKIPFEGQVRNNIIYEVCQYRKRLPIPRDCPQPFASIMPQCWLHDRKERPSIKKILEMLRNHSLTEDSRRSNQEWVLQRTIGKGKFGAVQDIAVSPTGEIAATDYSGGRLKLYSSTSGKLNRQVKFIDEHQSTTPYAVAVSSDGTYFVTDQTNCVTVIHSTSYTKHQFPVTLADESNCELMLDGLSLDNNGNLLIGCTTGKGGYLLTYTQDGVQQRSARVNIQPKYLASTWQNTVVVSSMDPQTVQVVDRSGKRLHTLDAPDAVSNWWPRGVCCTESRIMVANSALTPDTGIYCYSLSGQYLDCITTEVALPRGLAVVVDTDKTVLMVAERDEGVKVFSSTHPDMRCDDRRIVHFTRHTGSKYHSQASAASLLDNLSSPPESPLNLDVTDGEERGWKRSDSSTSDGSSLLPSESSASTSASYSSYSSSHRTESTCSSTGESLPSEGSLQQVQYVNDIWTGDSLVSEVASAYSDNLDWFDDL